MRKRRQELVLQTICLFSVGTGGAFAFEQLRALFFGAAALSKLPNLSANASGQHQQLIVGLSDVGTEEFDYTPNLAAQQNRETESAMKAFPGGHMGPRQRWVFDYVIDPDRLAAGPDAPWQSFAH